MKDDKTRQVKATVERVRQISPYFSILVDEDDRSLYLPSESTNRYDVEFNGVSREEIVEGATFSVKYPITEGNSLMPPVQSVAPVEQDDETTADDTSTMSDYPFIANDDAQDDTTDDFYTVGNMWTLGDHSTDIGADRDKLEGVLDQTASRLDEEIEGELLEVVEDARDLVSEANVTQFECPVEACGLGHSHSDHKHDIRSAFNVTESFASQMQFCPYCHCGVNELEMLLRHIPIIGATIFEGRDFSVLRDFTVEQVNKAYREDDPALLPYGREAFREYASLRDRVTNAADSAPIAQETRDEINRLDDELAELVAEE